MGECPNEMQLEHTKQLATHENEINNMKRTLSDLSMIKETLIKLTFLSEQTILFNERQNKSNEEFEKALGSINENLNTLNSEVGRLKATDEKEEISKTEIRVEDKRLSAERYKAKFTFYGVIVAGVLAAIGILIPLLVQ